MKNSAGYRHRSVFLSVSASPFLPLVAFSSLCFCLLAWVRARLHRRKNRRQIIVQISLCCLISCFNQAHALHRQPCFVAHTAMSYLSIYPLTRPSVHYFFDLSAPLVPETCRRSSLVEGQVFVRWHDREPKTKRRYEGALAHLALVRVITG